MGTKIKEVSKFEPNDPTRVVGAYSQSKAKASQMVMDSVKVMGLKACIVHPSGILGPNDHAVGETTETMNLIIQRQKKNLVIQLVLTKKQFTMKWNG